VIVGAVPAALTVSVAALLVALPSELVKTARTWSPLFHEPPDTLVAPVVSVVLVAPLTLAQEPVPPGLRCHCTVGVGVPEAAAVKTPAVGAVTLVLLGWVMMLGATLPLLGVTLFDAAEGGPVPSSLVAVTVKV
jgi:hypothetical protein